jgi:site-specific recombinase XerD
MEVTMADKRLLDYVPGYAAYMQSTTKLAPRTRTIYTYEVTLFAQNVGNPLLADLSPQMLLAWNQMLYDAGADVNTMGTKQNAVRRFLSYLEEFPENKEAGDHAAQLLKVAKRLNTPKDREPRRKPFALDEEQVRKMLDTAGKAIGGRGARDRAIIHLLWATGLRCAELADVRLHELELPERIGNIRGKGSKVRTVVFDAACQADLAKWLEVRAICKVQPGVDNVFISVSGRPLMTCDISRTVRDTAKAAGLRKEVWTHVFRHSRITSLLNRGMALQNVAVFAGHSNVQTTMKYFHQDPTKLRDEYDRVTRGRRKGATARPPQADEEGDQHQSELEGRR